jgi:exonuclease VII large subunit
MNKLILNFFGEEITIDTPKTLQNLKQEIASKFCFNPSDAAEILVSYFNDLKKTFIQTEQDFLDFIKKNIYKVDLDISQESQLYKNSMKKLQEETELDIKTLEGLIKANEEIENKKKAYIDEKNKQIKELDEKIKAITKQKIALMKETNKEKEIMNKEIKTNQKKIEELQKKLGLKISPIKEVKKQASPKPKPKPQPKKKPIVKKIAKKVVKIAKKVENKKKEEKNQENEEKVFLNIDNLTQNITQKIGEIGKMVLPLANQIVNKINENLDKKEIKLKAGAPNQEENKKVHTGIHCNGCGVNPIVGNRFKCAICDNFDYCEKCESLNKDSHKHPFIKIYSPENAPVEIKCELK